MKEVSPRAHIYRLVGLLILGVAGFVVARSALVPDTWNYSDSYREAFLDELAQKPMKHGGNDSCAGCHEDEEAGGSHKSAIEDLAGGAHAGLSCESCHGPLADHAVGGEKIAEARVDYSRLVCLTCHSNLISSPADFPKFIQSKEEIQPRREAELLAAAEADGDEKIFRHKSKIHLGMDCTECHTSFHDPEP